ncbi:hypothetical protein SAMN04487897_109155 [Paenibacillus sp. yr247]|nr:hypothetical protein SAMN04487897_109155 [Paenibacillus sp. yr247]
MNLKGNNYPSGLYTKKSGYDELQRLKASYTRNGYNLLYDDVNSISLWKAGNSTIGGQSVKFSLERTKLFWFRIRQEVEIERKI